MANRVKKVTVTWLWRTRFSCPQNQYFEWRFD